MHVYAGCPRIIRADFGTENTQIGTAQISFCIDHTDDLAGSKSFMQGASVRNVVCEWYNSLTLACMIVIIVVLWRKLKDGGHNLGGSRVIGGSKCAR